LGDEQSLRSLGTTGATRESSSPQYRYGSHTSAVAQGASAWNDQMSEIHADVRPHAPDIEDAKSTSFGASAGSAAEADVALLALERRFNAISAELRALERLRHDRKTYQRPVAQAPEQVTMEPCGEEPTCDEVVTRQIETVLASLDPIERAIMHTQARTIAGLGVKARHAAYVMSQYWEDPIDQIDWDARAVRLLIEAVCNVALTPLPFRNARGHE
jgi:pyrimidine deaminase RibD-like protein